VGAAGPATRSALSFEEIIAQSLSVLFPRFWFFHDGDPAYPLVASERGEAVPFLEYVRICDERFLHVRWYFVDDSDGDFFF